MILKKRGKAVIIKMRGLRVDTNLEVLGFKRPLVLLIQVDPEPACLLDNQSVLINPII